MRDRIEFIGSSVRCAWSVAFSACAARSLAIGKGVIHQVNTYAYVCFTRCRYWSACPIRVQCSLWGDSVTIHFADAGEILDVCRCALCIMCIVTNQLECTFNQATIFVHTKNCFHSYNSLNTSVDPTVYDLNIKRKHLRRLGRDVFDIIIK